MKKRLVVFACLVLLAFVAWLSFLRPVRMGVEVPASLIPPPVFVSLNRTNSPTRVFPGVSGVLIIPPDGSLWRWGGKIGVFPRAPIPQQIGTNCDWIEAFAANNHCVGRRADGTIWEWGYCGNKQMAPLPTQVGQDHNWMGIAAGDVHAVGLKTDGTVWGWGDNSMQQLGSGFRRNEPNPIQIGTNRDWKAISCGQGYHTVGLRTDGSLWVWGRTVGFENGQPGAVLSSPTRVCSNTNWIGLATGSAVRVFTESTIWDPLKAPPNPTLDAVSNCRLISSNSTPAHFALAFCGRPELYEIHSDGTLWTKVYPIGPWAKERDTWHQIGTRRDWLSIWGSGTVLGLTADGTIWTWGTDPGQEAVIDRHSRYKLFAARIFNWLGLASTGPMITSAELPHQKAPRPLMRFGAGSRPGK